MNGAAEDHCEKARLLAGMNLDEGPDALTADESAAMESHVEQCLACSQWRAQMRDIVASAKAFPQFDVSEALTQRILASVERERSGRASLLHVAAMVALLVAGAGVFVFDSVESLYGLVSWCLGLAAMSVVKAIIADGQSRKQPGG